MPVELIIREFGKPVADIVMEVTDDKNLPKEERKHRQIQAALKKSREAKLIKTKKSDSQIQCPLLGGGLNRSTQHFILEGKDGVWDGTKIS